MFLIKKDKKSNVKVDRKRFNINIKDKVEKLEEFEGLCEYVNIERNVRNKS
jgi:hypothetical protein